MKVISSDIFVSIKEHFINNLPTVFNDWLLKLFPNESFKLECLVGDAGFRQYFRLHFAKHTIIAVNAPPEKSNNNAFLAIAHCLEQESIHAPIVLYKNIEQGFFCLSDLGMQLLADIDYKNEKSVIRYYQTAIDNLLKMMTISSVPNYQLPQYDKGFIETELEIFPQWLLSTHLSLSLLSNELAQLNRCFSLLVNSALSQPTVFMHRDYHSRNIMLMPNHCNELAVIDFQDAVMGPITYDIVSLLRDCYVVLPQPLIEKLFAYFKVSLQQMEHSKLESSFLDIDNAQWQQWFDFMGLQRHIKAAGIFARLHHRDDKSGYLKDIPQTLSYIIAISEQYPELTFLHDLVKQQVLPAVIKNNHKVVNVL